VINITTGSNQFVIYCDAVNTFTEDYWLVGFHNIFTREWFYVFPTIISKTTRFVALSVDLVPDIEEDTYEGSIYLSPNGNWDYKVWNTADLDLDPTTGTLVEMGQMQLLTELKEVNFNNYVSDNEDATSKVYVSPISNYCLIWDLTRNWWNKEHTQFGACEGQVWEETDVVYEEASFIWNNA